LSEPSEAGHTRRGGFLVERVSRSMARSFSDLMRERGLGDIGPGEGRLVYLLWRGGPCRQGELAAKAGIDKSTLALTVARMERKGMVRRDSDGDDGRGVVVSLAPAAAARAEAFEGVSAAMTDLFYRGISDAEIDAFEATLARILGNLAPVT
jgi:DNA-binding MarR family transcriptional regulator